MTTPDQATAITITPRLLTCVMVVCDNALLGQTELMVTIQDYLLPLAEIDPAVALKLGGQRLLSLWLENAIFHGRSIDESSSIAVFAALNKNGAAFLTDAVVGRVAPAVWTSVAHYAVSENISKVLQLLYERVPLLDAPHALDIAAYIGDLDLLRWLHERFFGRSFWTSKAMKYASRGGHQPMVEWLCGNFPVHWTDTDKHHVLLCAMQHAAANGHLSLLQWLYAHWPLKQAAFALPRTILNGHYETATWLYDKLDSKRTRADPPLFGKLNWHVVLCDAYDKGDLPKFEWLRKHGFLKICLKYMDRAKIMGHVHVLEYVETHFPSYIDYAGAFNSRCARGGSIAAAQWAFDREVARRSAGAVDGDELHSVMLSRSASVVYEAAIHGHIEFIQWYVQTIQRRNISPRHAANVVPLVAARGHVECLQFLIENQFGTLSNEILVVASLAGQLRVVQWIAMQPGISLSACSIRAIAMRGHLHVIQWLYTQGVTFGVFSMMGPAGKGQLEIIQWMHKVILVDQDHFGDMKMLCVAAAERGHLDVVQYLMPFVHEHSRPQVAVRARRAGYGQVADWIEQHQDPRKAPTAGARIT